MRWVPAIGSPSGCRGQQLHQGLTAVLAEEALRHKHDAKRGFDD